MTPTEDSPGDGRCVRMDPRLSARRTAVLREQGQRRLRIVVAGVFGALVIVAGWFALHSPLFSARALTVTGNVHESAAQVLAQGGLTGHPALLDVNAGAVAARVEQLPWVQSAAVHVSWPDGVHVVVTEETPRLAVSEPGGRWATLSADGRVLSVTAARPPGLLLLTVPAAPGAAGTQLSVRDVAGLRVASTLPISFGAQVTAVTVEPQGWVQLAMTTPLLVDIGSASQLGAKYEDVSSILAAATLHNGDVIDVSVPDAPTVTSA
ncbi:MAG TPA: FtsQ-type POTRA domain-containing protein [Acidimicrobiales bacterium]